MAEELKLPAQTHAVTTVMVGWPAESPAPRARLPLGPHVHPNGVYSPISDSAVLQHYLSRETEGWERYRTLYGPSYVAKLTNLAQVCTTLKYSGQDYRLWSRRQLDGIEAQGFGRCVCIGCIGYFCLPLSLSLPSTDIPTIR